MALNLAFLWHMHQPSYADPRGGETILPWVRLHATRGYYDMVWALERYPDIKATFNLVPVLTEQIGEYLNGERDQYWRLSRTPARLLKTSERRFIIENFFACSLDSCIRPRARYYRLYQRAAGSQNDPATFSDADLRDLQVLFNLAWFGFGARVEYPLIEELESKGSGFSEDEKRKLLDIQLAVLRRLFKAYESLEERHQVELTTTPFYHPILPLIIDSDAAERCQPERPRPKRFSWPSDAQLQVEKAMTHHESCFGRQPKGMWPAEGSISPEAAALMTDAGITWAATDEALLWQSMGSGASNTRSSLYKAFRFAPENQGELDVIFRDHGLSDLIGFTYSRMDAQSAVDDFIERLERIHGDVDHDDPLVVVALDGENPWEYYPESGHEFLKTLYSRLADHASIKTVTVSQYLAHTDDRGTLNHLHSASWIDGNFGVWIGGEEENSAWELLGEARQAFEDMRSSLDEQTLATAQDHLLRAEGSDWFWWYGERFDSGNDTAFDGLFRGQIEQVYLTLGIEVPSKVKTSLVKTVRPLATEPPSQLISPDLTLPRSTYFDWLGAGTVNLAESGGSMARSDRVFETIKYGFDLDRTYLRFEPGDSPLKAGENTTLKIDVVAAARCSFVVDLSQTENIVVDGSDIDGDFTEHCYARYLSGAVELSFPFDLLKMGPDEQLSVSATLFMNDSEVARFPQQGHLEYRRPSSEFEARHWRV